VSDLSDHVLYDWKRSHDADDVARSMFSSTLSEEVRAVQEDIDAVAERIDNPSICQKIDKYVNAPFEVQTIFRKDAGQSSRGRHNKVHPG
jgi:hypothetical protein